MTANGNRQATANAWLSDLLDMDHGPIWRVPKRGRGLEKSPVRKLWDLGHHQRRMQREENGQQTKTQCPLQRDCANHHQGVSHDNQRAQTCTLERPGLQKHHQNSTRRPPRERRKNEISGGREQKKREILGGPGEGRSGGGESGGEAQKS